jgi:hypothetical protein
MKRQYKNINHAVNNILLGNGTNYKYKGKNPFGDIDKDGVINAYDCNPYNPNKQGFFTGARQSAKQLSQSLRGLFSKKTGAQVAKEDKSKAIAKISNQNVSGDKVLTSNKSGGASVVNVSSGNSSKNKKFVPSFVSQKSEPTANNTTTNQFTGQTKSINLNIPPARANAPTQSMLPQTPLQKLGSARKKFVSFAGGVLNIATPNLTRNYSNAPKSLSTNQQVGYQRRGTAYTIVPTTQDLRRLGYEERALQTDIAFANLRTDLNIDRITNEKYQTYGDELQKKYQDRLDEFLKNKKDLTQEEADTYVNEINSRLNDELNNRVKNEMKGIIKSETDLNSDQIKKMVDASIKTIQKRDAPYVFASSALSGLAIGTLATIAPPIGVGVGTLGTASLIAGAPEVASYAMSNPYGFFAGAAGGVFGGLAGNRIGKDLIKVSNNINLDNLLKKNKMTTGDLKYSYSVSASRGVKVGVDVNGNTLFNVVQTTKVKYINKKTGKVIDTATVYSKAKVASNTAEGAQRSAMESASMLFKEAGVVYDKTKNSITVKGDYATSIGTSTSRKIVKNIYRGNSQSKIRTGKVNLEITNQKVLNDFTNVFGTNTILKRGTRLSNDPTSFSESSFVNRMYGSRRTSKKFGTIDLFGTERTSKTGSVTNVAREFSDTGKRLKVPKTSRDVGVDYAKFFFPTKIKFNALDFDFQGRGSQVLVNRSPKTSITKSTIQSQLKGEVIALTSNQGKNVVKSFNRNILSNANPRVITKSTNTNAIFSSISPSLIESNYPTYVGGTKVSATNFLTGGVVSESYDYGKNYQKQNMKFNDINLKSEYKPMISNVLLGIQNYGLKGKTKSKNKLKTLSDTKIGYQTLIEVPSAIRYRTDSKYKINYKLNKPIQIGYKYKSMSNMSNNTFTPIPFNFNLPSFSGGGYSSSKSNTYYKGKKRKTAYAPSLSAFQLGLSAPKGYKTNKKYTGLEIRPVLYDTKETFDDSYRKRLSKIANFF